MGDDKLHWISSLDTFEHPGLTWDDVHEVEDAFWDKFEKGSHCMCCSSATPLLDFARKCLLDDLDLGFGGLQSLQFLGGQSKAKQ